MEGLHACDKLLSMFLRNYCYVPRKGIIGTCTACGLYGNALEIRGECTISVCENCNKPCSIRLYSCPVDKQFVDDYPRMRGSLQAAAKRFVLRELVCMRVHMGHCGYSVCMCCYQYLEYTYHGDTWHACAGCGESVKQTLSDMCTKGMYLGIIGITGNVDVDKVLLMWFCRVYVGV